MKTLQRPFGKYIAALLSMLLAFPLAETAAALPQQSAIGQQQSGPSAAPPPQDSSSADSPAQPGATQQQDGVTRPVGTAAAPVAKTSGVTASRPAGAVIAPAKQRRARAILIRVGIVLGAAVAVGTVVALSRASPSRPN